MPSDIYLSDLDIAYYKPSTITFNWDYGTSITELSDYHNHKKSIEKEEKNMNKYDELLKLYKDKMEEKINKKYDETTENICEDDLIQKIISEAKQKIKEELTKREEPKDLIEDIESELDNIVYLTSATDKILDELRTKQDNELNELYDTLKEVKARLAMTDDYDTQMKILKEYEITDINGRLEV